MWTGSSSNLPVPFISSFPPGFTMSQSSGNGLPPPLSSGANRSSGAVSPRSANPSGYSASQFSGSMLPPPLNRTASIPFESLTSTSFQPPNSFQLPVPILSPRRNSSQYPPQPMNVSKQYSPLSPSQLKGSNDEFTPYQSPRENVMSGSFGAENFGGGILGSNGNPMSGSSAGRGSMSGSSAGYSPSRDTRHLGFNPGFPVDVLSQFGATKTGTEFVGDLSGMSQNSNYVKADVFTGITQQISILSIAGGYSTERQVNNNGDVYLQVNSGAGSITFPNDRRSYDGRSYAIEMGYSALIPEGTEYIISAIDYRPLKITMISTPE